MRSQRMMPTVILCLGLAFVSAYGQTTREFNWIPSGNLDVGDMESENDSEYRSMGEIIATELVYSDGTRLGDNLAREALRATRNA